MCVNPFVLSFIFIIKILVLIAIPLFVLFFKNIDKRINKYLFIAYIIIVSIFIILLFFNNSCIKNSTILGIIRSTISSSDTYIYEDKDYSNIEKITTDDIYKTRNNKDVYYYSNNYEAFSNKKLSCDKKDISMGNYGYLISTMSTMLSTTLNKSINEIELLNLVYYNGIIDCEKGIDFNKMVSLIEKEYNVSLKTINSNSIFNYLNNDVVVLERVEYNQDSSINLTCDKGYIILYKYDNNDKIKILDSNNKDYDYLCPDNTRGVMTIIKADTNNGSYELDDLVNIGTKFMIMEVK